MSDASSVISPQQQTLPKVCAAALYGIRCPSHTSELTSKQETGGQETGNPHQLVRPNESSEPYRPLIATSTARFHYQPGSATPIYGIGTRTKQPVPATLARTTVLNCMGFGYPQAAQPHALCTEQLRLLLQQAAPAACPCVRAPSYHTTCVLPGPRRAFSPHSYLNSESAVAP